MQLRLSKSVVRSWEDRDAESVARHGDSHAIWRNMRDRFPRPYTREHAQAYIAVARAEQPETRFAIDVGGEAVGGIGFMLHPDVERVSAEIGYWLAETHWGRGIATEAVQASTRHAIDTFSLTRVYAVPFATNRGSVRVLEKAGFTLEGRMRRSAIKEGQIVDQLLYAFTPE